MLLRLTLLSILLPCSIGALGFFSDRVMTHLLLRPQAWPPLTYAAFSTCDDPHDW